MNQDQMKPLNRFFVFIYYLVGLIADILHPVTVEGLERLPKSGALLCPNHASNWDPILLATALPRDYRLRVMGKEELFPTVIHDGALPRKTFSMGHAQDKRYYTECRKIRK